MRALWPSLHGDLMQSIDSLSFQQRFRAFHSGSEALRPFPDPHAVLSHLHADLGDPDRKNQILADLVVVAQGGAPYRDCGTVLLWLALWPGLDALYRRLLRHFPSAPEDLVSEISYRMTTGIHRLDLDRVHRIAATLLRNIERDIRKMLRIRRDEAASRVDMPEEDALPDPTPGPVDRSFDDARLAGLLDKWIGTDAALVLAVAVNGETQVEAGLRLGIGHEAARKRYQRAIRRLRLHIEEIR